MKRNALLGFLPYPSDIEFNGGIFELLPDYEKGLSWFEERTNQDRFIYPAETYKVGVTPSSLLFGMNHKRNQEKEIPKTRRPGFFHRLPMSHRLVLDYEPIAEDFILNDGSFLIFIVSYLFGYRLHFAQWYIEGRVPGIRTHNIHVTQKGIRDFISHSYKVWRGWPEKERLLMTNILCMNSRSPMYELNWERFALNYMVFDACYQLASRIHSMQLCKHEERIISICDRFGIPSKNEKDIIRLIVKFRNELFHEALWDGDLPGATVGSPSTGIAYCLRNLNHRLIPAILGYETEYIHTSWLIRGTLSFA